MSDMIQTVRAYALHHPDPRVRKFMQERIQKELGPPPLPEIEPPVHLSPQEMGRKMIEAAQMAQSPIPVQPAPEQEIGQPRACGATVDQATGHVEPLRDLREIKPMPKSDLPAPNQRNGKWVGRPFDLENEMQPQRREPGE